MAEIQEGYDNNKTVTITLASLADGATATSSAIDNTTDLFINADIQLKFMTTSTVDASGYVALVLQRTADGGATYDGVDENAENLGMFIANSDDTTYVVSATTGKIGTLPSQWKLSVINETGAAFEGTPGNFSLKFVGKYVRTIP